MIKEHVINYRNSHKESRVLLGVLLGEFESLEKSKKRKVKEITDAECITIIKKMIKDNIECNELEENKILGIFIPKQLTDFEISAILTDLDFQSIGECMRYFKENFTGFYDGKSVKELFELWINPKC